MRRRGRRACCGCGWLACGETPAAAPATTTAGPDPTTPSCRRTPECTSRQPAGPMSTTREKVNSVGMGCCGFRVGREGRGLGLGGTNGALTRLRALL
eukprot:1240206-Rhodomonas_salina.3